MSTKKQTPNKPLSLAIAGILSLGSVSAMNAQAAVPDKPDAWEKCSGIAKAGKNDCGALDGSHDCAAQAKTDGSKNEWVYVPKGTCEKIVGGNVEKVKPAKS